MNPWVPIVATLLGGGAMGAFIGAYFVYRRNKRQPAVYTKEIIHVFRKNRDFRELDAKLMVKDKTLEGEPERAVDNLSLVRIKVTNKGNQDVGEYTFGVTMKGSNKHLDMRMSPPDRHHEMIVSFKNPVDDSFANRPDFSLKPFNRGETYGVDIYFTYEESPGEIVLGSSHSMKLVAMKESTKRWRLNNELSFGLGVFLALLLPVGIAVYSLVKDTIALKQEKTIEQRTLELKESIRALEEARKLEEKALASPTPQPSK